MAREPIGVWLLVWVAACSGKPVERDAGRSGPPPLSTAAGGGVGPGPTSAVQWMDSDGDALPDRWEIEGVDIEGDGTIDLDLPAMGADPDHKDVFVEVDWMEAREPDEPQPHSDRLSLSALERVQEAFARAPVDNPDGETGIALHIDAGPDSLMDPRRGLPWGELSGAGAIPHELQLSLERQAMLRDAYLDPARDRVFRYAIAAHDVAPLPMPLCEGEDWVPNGLADGARMIVSLSVQDGVLVELGGYLPGERDELQQASLFMHELGHTLGLAHGGHEELNRKPNYLSVMNYSFSYRGVPIDGEYGNLDYSRFSGTLDETSLDETAGLQELVDDGSTRGTLFYCGDVFVICRSNAPRLTERISEVSNLSQPIDWNCDGEISPQPVAAEINLQPPRTELVAQDDWVHLDYSAWGHLGPLTAYTLGVIRAGRPTPCGPDAFPVHASSAASRDGAHDRAAPEITSSTLDRSPRSIDRVAR